MRGGKEATSLSQRVAPGNDRRGKRSPTGTQGERHDLVLRIDELRARVASLEIEAGGQRERAQDAEAMRRQSEAACASLQTRCDHMRDHMRLEFSQLIASTLASVHESLDANGGTAPGPAHEGKARTA